MVKLRMLWSRVKGQTVQEREEEGFDDEIREHLALLEQRYTAQGMSTQEAALTARRQFGSPPVSAAVSTVRVANDPFMIVMRREHPMAGMKSVELTDVAKFPWVFFERRAHPSLHDGILRRMQEKNLHAHIRHHVTQADRVPVSGALRHHDSARYVRLQVFRGWLCMSRRCGGEGKAKNHSDPDAWKRSGAEGRSGPGGNR